MNEVVQEFIRKKQEQLAQKQKEEYEALKAKTLVKLGLVEKEYSPDGKYSDEYLQSEYDEVNKCNKFYKIVPISVTDEEFEELKKCLPPEEKDCEEETKSGVSTLLKIFAWIVYIGGFVAGFILGADRWGDPTFMTVVYWLIFLLVGTMYMGFAKIIDLLCNIKDNTNR